MFAENRHHPGLVYALMTNESRNLNLIFKPGEEQNKSFVIVHGISAAFSISESNHHPSEVIARLTWLGCTMLNGTLFGLAALMHRYAPPLLKSEIFSCTAQTVTLSASFPIKVLDLEPCALYQPYEPCKPFDSSLPFHLTIKQ